MTIGIPFFREAKTYKCPICGKEHALDDCIIVKEKINRKFLNRTYDSQLSTYRTKVFKDIYLVSYYNIRICPKCAKKRHIPYVIIHALFIIALVALMIRNVVMSDLNDFGSIISGILLVLFCGGFLGVFILGGSAWIVEQFQKIDIEKAKEYNAIAHLLISTFSSNPQLSPSMSFLRVHVLSLLNYHIN